MTAISPKKTQKLDTKTPDSGPASSLTPASDDAVKAAEREFNLVRQDRLRMAKEIEDLKAEKMQRSLDALESEKAASEAHRAKISADAAAKTTANDVSPISAPEATETSNVPPPAPKARLRGRHVVTLFSFLIFAIGPVLLTAWYMWDRALDRYISRAGFSVRTEEVGSAFELLGGITELSGSSSTDTEILFQFIQSQELVRNIDNAVDLRAIWSDTELGRDPIFTYDAPGSIEDLTAHWARMVSVYSDSGTGLIDIEVQAFTPQDAQAVNQLIYDESLAMINRLSAIAREDGTRYAREDLDSSVERLKDARSVLTQFRNRTQIVDPAASIQSQMGIMSSLQSALANELIELDVLIQSTSQDDPRIVRARQRIDVIEARIVEERNKFGIGDSQDSDSGTPAFAELVGEYERLAVDLEFAEGSYRAAQATLDTSLAEARRQSRYLAAHIQPTLPESAEAPDRLQITSLVALFSFLAWAIATLSAYSIRDRR